MTVHIVMRSYPNLDLVDDDLNIFNYEVGEIVGVYHDAQEANKRAVELLDESKEDESKFDCDQILTWVEEWNVR